MRWIEAEIADIETEKKYLDEYMIVVSWFVSDTRTGALFFGSDARKQSIVTIYTYRYGFMETDSVCVLR